MSDILYKDFTCLLGILESIEKINSYSKPFSNADELYENSLSFDAVMMNFIIIGEMVEKLTNDFKQSTESKVNWHQIWGFRNIIAHNYFGIDAEEVWQIINNNLADLEKEIRIITN